jgi:uridine kinase
MNELILISGGSCSGKTTLAKLLKKEYGSKAVLISTDNFYKGIGNMHKRDGKMNFDHPDAIDFESLYDSAVLLLAGKSCQIPQYDFATHSRLDENITVEPADIIIIEGIFALYCEKLRKIAGLKVFVDCDKDDMIRRRIIRDQIERGRTTKDIVAQMLDTVLPMYCEYVHPTKRFADMIFDGKNPIENCCQDIKAIIPEE